MHSTRSIDQSSEKEKIKTASAFKKKQGRDSKKPHHRRKLTETKHSKRGAHVSSQSKKSQKILRSHYLGIDLHAENAPAVFIKILTRSLSERLASYHYKAGWFSIDMQLISSELIKNIEMHIQNALHQIELSLAQTDIINDAINFIKRSGRLPPAVNSLVGDMNGRPITMKVTGLCKVVYKFLDFGEQKALYQIFSFKGSMVDLQKSIQNAFFEFCINAATPKQLQQLKDELEADAMPGLAMLRQAHGFFSLKSYRSTGRYKYYKKALLLACKQESDSDNHQDRSVPSSQL